MRLKKVSVIFFCVLLVPLVFASISINIRTLPEHRVSVIIREAGKLSSIDSFHKDTGNGNLSFSSDSSVSSVDLLVILKKEEIKILNEKFESVSTSDPIDINLIPGKVKLGFEEEVSDEKALVENSTNKTVSVKEKVVEKNANETKSKITGIAVKEKEISVNSKIVYYIIGGILIVSVLIFFIFLLKRSQSSIGKNFKVKKMSEYGSFQSNNDKINAAKKKLKEALDEIEKLKG